MLAELFWLEMDIVTQLLLWYLTLIALSIAGLPVTLTLFKTLPDQGYAFSRAAGLLFAGYLAWVLTILGFTEYTTNLLIFLVLAIGIIGCAILPQRASRLAALRSNWRTLLGYESLFLISFLFLAWIRSYDPNPQGTERPMDYALYNAIMHSATFPPHDPWLSGYAINYYYLGYLLMGIPTMLSGVNPGAGYNLSLATLFALTAVHVASLVNNLIALRDGREVPNSSARIGRIAAPVLAAIFVLLASNQAGVLEVLARTEKVVALDAQQTWLAVHNGVLGDPQLLELPYATLPTDDFGAIQNVQLLDEWSNFNWWWPSRALWDDYVIGGIAKRVYNITEFPFFSFYLGDMHPHVMSLPFTLLVVALVLAWMARRRLPAWWHAAPSQRVLFILSAIVVGSLYFLNSWDLPTYVLFFLMGTVWIRRQAQSMDELPSWREWSIQLITFLSMSVLLYFPFYISFRSFAGATNLPPFLERIPVVRTLATMIGVVFWSKSSLHQEFIIFGLFAVPVAAYLLTTNLLPALHTPSKLSVSRIGPGLDLDNPKVWGMLVLLGFGLGFVVGFPLLGLVPVIAYTFRSGLSTCETSTAFVFLGVSLLSFILVAAEIFFIPDVFGTRMNTIFKFYYQVWTLGGMLAAYAIWVLVKDIKAPGLRALRLFTLTLAGVLFVGAMVYAALAMRERMQGASQGLNGVTAREAQNAGEREAVAWLRAHAASDAVLLEAVGSSYDTTGTGAGSLAGATGLQTVLGWPGHEDQWRHGDPTLLAQIPIRQSDVQSIYTSADAETIRQLLDKYQVDYVVVGNPERRTYPSLNTRVFEGMMSRVFVSADRNVLIFAR